MNDHILNILVLLALVLLNGYFVAAEFSLVKVRSSRITQLLSEGVQRARHVQIIINDMDAYLSACQLGITLASLGLGMVGEVYLESMLEPIFRYIGVPESSQTAVTYGVAFGIITVLHIVLGELAPKSLAIQKTESVALWLAPPLRLFYKTTYPAIWVLNGMSNIVLKMFGLSSTTEHDEAHTEEEIRILLNESQENGVIDKDDGELFENVFQFANRVAREALIPRTDMAVLFIEDSFEDNLDKVNQTRHTRYPVADKDKDTILGFIHVTDLYAESKKEKDRSINNILREILTVPEFEELSEVLKLMKKNRVQIAIVADEYGGTSGLVTLEDILEEIVGEIQDEFDNTRPVFEETDNGYSIDGRMLIQDVNYTLNLSLSNDDVDTIGSWVHMMIEDDLEVGKNVTSDNYTFEITEVEKSHIVRLKATKVYDDEEVKD